MAQLQEETMAHHAKTKTCAPQFPDTEEGGEEVNSEWHTTVSQAQAFYRTKELNISTVSLRRRTVNPHALSLLVAHSPTTTNTKWLIYRACL